MTPIRALASVLGVANGAFASYIAMGPLNATYNCPFNGCPASMFYDYQALVVVGLLLVVAALVSLKGFGWAFLLSGGLSIAVLALVVVKWGAFGSNSLPSVVLAVAAAAVEFAGSRPERELSEKDSPLNLPVFG